MTPTFKPSLRHTLPPESHDAARVALLAQREHATSTPWFVRVLIGGGAWLASLFLMLFVGVALSSSDKTVFFVLGLMMVTGAVFLRRMDAGLFLNQVALAVSLAGQGLFTLGMKDVSDTTRALALCVLETLLLFVYPDLIHRFLSASAAALALLYALYEGLFPTAMSLGLVGLAVLVHGLFLQQGALQTRRWGEVVTPAAFGLVTVLLFMLGIGAGTRELFGDEGPDVLRILLTMGLAAVTLYSAWRVLEELHTAPGGPAGVTLFASLSVLSVLTVHAPGVIAAAGVLMLGFHRRSVVLLGMAVVFLLGFGVRYYYDLEITLLAKSLALLGGGLLLLGLRLFILYRLPAASEES